MRALLGYRVATLTRSQRWAAPAVLFVVAVTVGTWDDSGPLLPAYALCSAVLLVAATRLSAAAVDIEEPEQRAVTVVAVGPRAALLSQAGAALLFCVALAVVGLVLPLVVGRHVVTTRALTVGFGGEFGCAVVGLGIGMLCCRWVIPRTGYAMLTALTLVVLAVVVPYASPVNPMLHELSSDHPSAAAVAGLGVAALAATCCVGEFVHRVVRLRS